jgi:hypothetical protein
MQIFTMNTFFQLIETFIRQLATSKTSHQKMPALIPLRVITKVNRDQY